MVQRAHDPSRLQARTQGPTASVAPHGYTIGMATVEIGTFHRQNPTELKGSSCTLSIAGRGVAARRVDRRPT